MQFFKYATITLSNGRAFKLIADPDLLGRLVASTSNEATYQTILELSERTQDHLREATGDERRRWLEVQRDIGILQEELHDLREITAIDVDQGKDSLIFRQLSQFQRKTCLFCGVRKATQETLLGKTNLRCCDDSACISKAVTQTQEDEAILAR